MYKLSTRKRIRYSAAFSIYFFCSLLINSVSAQSNKGEVYKFARKIVDTMASESMHGRGYVNDGDGIAANYIRSEFRKLKLLSFTEDYYQRFDFPVNTFPGEMSVKIDGSNLIPGKDFIVFSHSPSFTGKYPVVIADEKLVLKKKRFEKFLKKDFRNKILVVNDTGKQTPQLHDLLGNNCSARAVIALKDKLTWSVGREVNNYPLVEILRTAVSKPKEIEITIENKFITNHQSQNVIGYVKGSEYPDSFIVFSAHYDHLGQMGKDVYFPGANDNASGCAMLLNMAKYYSMSEHKPKYSIVFMAFCGEEAGLLGSK